MFTMLRPTNHSSIHRFHMLLRHGSTSPVYLQRIFQNLIAPLPTWSKSPPPSILPVSRQWEEFKRVEKRSELAHSLRSLQDTLRFLHKRKIAWPDDELVKSNIPPNKYLATLLHPIPKIFDYIREPGVLNTPMEYIPINIDQSIYGATFVAEDFKKDNIFAPIVICLPDSVFQSTGKVSARVEFAISKALEYQPLVPSIIVTNFDDIVVFYPPSQKQPKPLFERVFTTKPGLAVRVITTACLFQELTFNYHYLNRPCIAESTVEVVGPPNDPHLALLPDEELLETHQRHSDFDHSTLIHDLPRALQFYRWHDLVRQRCTKVVTRPDDILTCVTNEVGERLPDIQPCYPYDASELPPDTVAHLAKIRRESPLVMGGLHDAFDRSKIFTVKIESIIAEGSRRSICTVYRCRITSIDDHPESSPSICLKLFDDRFQLLASPEDYGNLSDDLRQWFESVVIAEHYALNEKFAYDKLLQAQGTVIPWFYGMHQFTLPDGTVLYGILMEYIEGGTTLQSDFAHNLSSDRQISFIRSCRHAARVLDVADIDQHDWHHGQIILHTDARTHIDHAVFIDLASTTQTWEYDEPNLLSNYFHVLLVLLGNPLQHTFDWGLVWEHYEGADDWDTIRVNMSHISKAPATVEAEYMFPYIVVV